MDKRIRIVLAAIALLAPISACGGSVESGGGDTANVASATTVLPRRAVTTDTGSSCVCYGSESDGVASITCAPSGAPTGAGAARVQACSCTWNTALTVGALTDCCSTCLYGGPASETIAH